MEQNSSDIHGRSWLIVISSLILGLAFNFLIFGKTPGLGFSIFITLIAVAFLSMSLYLNKPIKSDLKWLIPLLLFFAFMVSFRASHQLTALNILGCLFLMILIAETNVRGSVKQFNLLNYLAIPLTPLFFLKPFYETGAEVVSIRTRNENQKQMTQILRGILISIPVLIVFGLLFSSADQVFEKYATNIININLNEETAVRIIFIIAVSMGLIGAYAYLFGGKAFSLDAFEIKKRFIGNAEASILLGSINILFLTFILIQVAYLFGGEDNIAAQGFTYAEYARRGFFELIAVCLMTFAILLSAEKFIEKKAEKHSSSFKIFSSLLVLQVGAIMASALYRLSMYESAFGFTVLRLYSHAFIFLLASVFAFLLYKIVFEGDDNFFAFQIFWAAIIFVAGMNLFNPDAFIARKNLERYKAIGNIDMPHLASLSADATPISKAALDIPDEKIKQEAIFHFQNKIKRMQSRDQSWQSWNFGAEKERETLLQLSL